MNKKSEISCGSFCRRFSYLVSDSISSTEFRRFFWSAEAADVEGDVTEKAFFESAQ
ncbi:hypothetical protein [Priestia megaterium]|uniref:hypothetical protein n=1 Tax=Priestia megaterium TaxID=1404 RepID=UPI0035B5C50E